MQSGIKVRKSSENSPKPNIEFSFDFKADFVGFSQKPYKVGFFAYIYFYNTRRSIITKQTLRLL